MPDLPFTGGPLAAASVLGAEARDERALHERMARVEMRQEHYEVRHAELVSVLAENKAALTANTAALTSVQIALASKRDCPDPGACLALRPRLDRLETGIARMTWTVICGVAVAGLLGLWEMVRGK